MQLSPLEVILRGKTGIVSTPDDYWVAGYFLGRCNKKRAGIEFAQAVQQIEFTVGPAIEVFARIKLAFFFSGGWKNTKWCHLHFSSFCFIFPHTKFFKHEKKFISSFNNSSRIILLKLGLVWTHSVPGGTS